MDDSHCVLCSKICFILLLKYSMFKKKIINKNIDKQCLNLIYQKNITSSSNDGHQPITMVILYPKTILLTLFFEAALTYVYLTSTTII